MDRPPVAGDPAMNAESIFPTFDVCSTMPRVKPFDEAQTYGAGVRSVKEVRHTLGFDQVDEAIAATHRRCIAALGRGERVILTVNGIEVATFEPWV